MEFIVDRVSLFENASNAGRAALSKSAVSSLEGLLIKTIPGGVSITGYDLEMGIITSLPCKVSGEGEVVISSRLFCDILRKMNSETVTLKTDNNELIIDGGNSHFKIIYTDSTDYPEIADFDITTTFDIKGDILRSMIDETLFAVAANDQKAVYTGSLFELSPDKLRIVSVDGFRLAMRDEKIESDMNASFIVPSKTLSDLSKMIGDDDTVSFSVGRKNVAISFGVYKIISRLLDGVFLDYEHTIPKESTTEVYADTKEFIDAIDRTSLLITDRLRSPLRVEFLQREIKMSCITSMGSASDNLPCKAEGNELMVGFNNKYLLDALKACGCETVKLSLNQSTSAVKITSDEKNNFLYLILPVRLRVDG